MISTSPASRLAGLAIDVPARDASVQPFAARHADDKGGLSSPLDPSFTTPLPSPVLPPGPRTQSFFADSPPPLTPPRSRASSSVTESPKPDLLRPVHAARPRTVSGAVRDFESYLTSVDVGEGSGRHGRPYTAPSRHPTILHGTPAQRSSTAAKGKQRASLAPTDALDDHFVVRDGAEYSDDGGSIKVVRTLGQGAFSQVCLAKWRRRKRASGDTDLCEEAQVAVKLVIKRECRDNERIRVSTERELEVLKNVRHPALAHLLSTIETRELTCLLLDWAPGGELFDLVEKHHSQLTGELIRRIFVELADLLNWMHCHAHLVHRDLKLENILLSVPLTDLVAQSPSQWPSRIVRLTDFGLSRFIDPDNPMLETRCGSEEYAATELIIGTLRYDARKTDAWALGVVLYALLCGHLPFVALDQPGGRRAFLLAIAKGAYSWSEDAQHATPEARAIVSSLIERDPSKRATAGAVLKMAWLEGVKLQPAGDAASVTRL